MATLLFSSGVPMISGGDEFGRTQWGNNNPYCLDIEEMWFDWDHDPWQQDLLETVRHLIRLRREFPVLRQRTFFTGRPVHEYGLADVTWFGGHGHPLSHHEWESGATHTLAMLLEGGWIDTDGMLLLLHGSPEESAVVLPRAPEVERYELLWSSEWDRPDGDGDVDDPGRVTAAPADAVTMAAASMRVYRIRRAESPHP